MWGMSPLKTSLVYKSSRLLQAQGFRLVTPDPFLVRGLGLGRRLLLGGIEYSCNIA